MPLVMDHATAMRVMSGVSHTAEIVAAAGGGAVCEGVPVGVGVLPVGVGVEDGGFVGVPVGGGVDVEPPQLTP